MNKIIRDIEKLIRKNLDTRGMDHINIVGSLENSAQSLLKGDSVIILTGFVIRDTLTGETDGPLGAASLGASLEKLGKKVTFVTDKYSEEILKQACRVLNVKGLIKSIDHGNEMTFAKKIINEVKPSHIIAIERPGRAKDGRPYSMRGEDLSDLVPNTDVFFDLALSRGITRIAIGDGGNELGMANVFNEVVDSLKNGEKICAVKGCDHLILAGVSNWGGHALGGALSLLAGQFVLHSGQNEKIMLKKMVEAGAVDGCTKKSTLTVDGLSFEDNLDILLKIADLVASCPKVLRSKIRIGEMQSPTSGKCRGYVQGNLVILPQNLAVDFEAFAKNNPIACPILEISDVGNPTFSRYAPGSNILTDVPKYRVYKDGQCVTECSDIKKFWRQDYVAFLLGCSFTFESALMNEGIPMRHIEENRNVAMYITNINCKPVGVFGGPLVVSMRPIAKTLVSKVVEITSRYPKVHGGPMHIGNPELIGIKDISKPDYGHAVEIKEDEVPVFWACGVTTQTALGHVKGETIITHAPGYMFVTDIKNEELEVI